MLTHYEIATIEDDPMAMNSRSQVWPTNTIADTLYDIWFDQENNRFASGW